jgi:heme/copper-type cytochrome/quinol oxidase subunit 2
MGDLGRALVIMGAVIIVVGVALMLAGRFNLPLGRLPGDITWRGKNTVVYFPIATSIVVSIVLSLLLYLISRFRG